MMLPRSLLEVRAWRAMRACCGLAVTWNSVDGEPSSVGTHRSQSGNLALSSRLWNAHPVVQVSIHRYQYKSRGEPPRRHRTAQPLFVNAPSRSLRFWERTANPSARGPDRRRLS
jgi:hypothetical protein